MIIYRLSHGLHRGRWVLEVDGIIWDTDSRLATLRQRYPSAHLSMQYQECISA